MSVSVIIPAYRAASELPSTIAAARAIPGVSEVVVVDDGSRDGSGEAARQAGADRVVSLPRNRGKGGALAAGVEAARGERLLFIDADLGASAARAGRLLESCADGRTMAVAILPQRPGAGGIGLALGLARAAIRLLTGLQVAAPLSGQRALPASLARHAGLAPRFGVEVGLTVEASQLGVPVVEVSVPLEHSRTGRTLSGFLHRGRQFMDVLAVLLLVGYGIGWPALSRAHVAARIVLWLSAFSLVIGLGALGAPSAVSVLGASAVAALFAWLPSLWLGAVCLGLRKANYLGRSVPAASGLLFPLVVLPALWFSPLPTGVLPAGILVVATFAAAGLFDDLHAWRSQARGLRGHLRALARGRITTGLVKALAGLAAGLAAGLILHGDRPGLVALDALAIALSANFVNLLDLRPGRALKGFALIVAVALGISPNALLFIGPLLAAALVSAPSDFAGRAMMGDVGANVLGGAAGLALVLALSPSELAFAVLLLAGAHLLCERFSLSDLIARNGLLRAIDLLGATHLRPLATEEVGSR